MISRRSSTAYGMALLVGTGVLWGTIGPVSKEITLHSSLDAVSITWLRTLIASPICLLAAWQALGSRMFSAARADQVRMIALGAVLIFYQWSYLASIDRIGVSAATLISLCGAPVIVAVASGFLLGEQLTRRVWLALAGAIAGSILIIGRPETGDGVNTAAGVALAIACAAGIATHAMGLRSIANRVHPLQPLAYGFPVGAILFAPVALSLGVSFDQSARTWLLLLFLGLVPSSIAYLFYQRGLQAVPASVASIVTMIEPLIAAVLAWIMFDERLGFLGWIGGAILLASIWLLSRRR